MKTLFLFGLLSLIAVGCSWNPERDNPFDPESKYYSKPLPRNRAPEVDSIRTVVDCRARENPNDFCAFRLLFSLHDADNNIRYNTLQARLDTIFLGYPAFDPVENQFSLEKTQDDFPNHRLADFIGDTLWVDVADDSGAATRGWTVYHMPNLRYPSVIFPIHPETDTVSTHHPMLVWQPWNGDAQNRHTFTLSIYFRDLYKVWDTSRVAYNVDTVWVGDSLRDSNVDPTVFYTWYLTVVDREGNRLTSTPGVFKILIPLREPAEAKRESFANGTDYE